MTTFQKGFVVAPIIIWTLVGLFTVAAVSQTGLVQLNLSGEGGLLKVKNLTEKQELLPNPNPSSQSENEALSLVANLQEVKEFKKRIEDIGIAKPIVAIDGYPDSENPYYLVHVFEEVPDSADTFHTATFNWYRVDPKTWTVTRLDLSTKDEKWDIVDTTGNITATPIPTVSKPPIKPKPTPQPTFTPQPTPASNPVKEQALKAIDEKISKINQQIASLNAVIDNLLQQEKQIDSDRYSDPQSEMYIDNPYGRESLLAGRSQMIFSYISQIQYKIQILGQERNELERQKILIMSQ